MKIYTIRIFSQSNKSSSLESLMEKVDHYLNKELKQPNKVLSASYVPVEDKFCAVITLEI